MRRGGLRDFRAFKNVPLRANSPSGKPGYDSALPIEVTVTGWNPFIPLDDKNSGIPCVCLEYTLRNTSVHPVDYEFSYHLSHLAPGCKPDQAASVNAVIPGKGVFLYNTEQPNAESFGSAALTVIGARAAHQGHVAAQHPGWDSMRSRTVARGFHRQLYDQ